MNYNMEETLRAIRRDCRLAMNGVVSTSMREYGLDYKLNFGLMNQQIKALADKYGASKELAEKLWTENTRELKILATLVYPIEEFTSEDAYRWIKNIPNQEIREQICFNLLQNIPSATLFAKEWMLDDDKNVRTTAYWLMTRLLLAKKVENQLLINDMGDYIWEDIFDQETFLRKASLGVLKHLVRQSKEEAQATLNKLESYNEDKEDQLKQKAYQEIAFEVEFLYS